jgi:pimeloyl-ACP methyl ester carboxylesterase
MWKGDSTEKEFTAENLARITHPTLLIYEESSIFFKSYEVLKDRLPNAKSVLLKDGKLKHFTVLENPEELLAKTRAFLAGDELAEVGAS